ncbi:MAG: pyridoxal phosphate-dependent aminotransferase [Myxococcota bacterium]
MTLRVTALDTQRMTRFSRRTAWDQAENALSRRAAALIAEGIQLLDFTASNPTEAELPYPDQEIRAAVAGPALLRYAPDPRGSAEARAAVAAHYQRRGAPVDPARLFLTASTSEAYGFLFRLLLDPGDTVLAPAPSYPLFDLLLDLADAEKRTYRLRYDGAWYLDKDSLEAGLAAGARLILLVSPNNPTGTVLSPEERRFLRERAAFYGAAVISDEVFADFSSPWSEASWIGTQEVLSFSLSGLSKVAGLPQLKLGWIVPMGPAPLVAEAERRLELIADTALSVSRAAEISAPRVLELAEAWQGSLRERLAHNRAEIQRQILGTSLSLRPSHGGWSAILDRARLLDDEAFALRLLEADHVLAFPGYFYDIPEEGSLVLSLLLPEVRFAEGLARVIARAETPWRPPSAPLTSPR